MATARSRSMEAALRNSSCSRAAASPHYRTSSSPTVAGLRVAASMSMARVRSEWWCATRRSPGASRRRRRAARSAWCGAEQWSAKTWSFGATRRRSLTSSASPLPPSCHSRDLHTTTRERSHASGLDAARLSVAACCVQMHLRCLRYNYPGGAIYAHGGLLTIDACLFAYNTVPLKSDPQGGIGQNKNGCASQSVPLSLVGVTLVAMMRVLRSAQCRVSGHRCACVVRLAFSAVLTCSDAAVRSTIS